MDIVTKNRITAEEYCKKASKLIKEGKLEEAIAQYDGALKVNPRYIPALNQLGTIYENKKEFDKASALYQQILELRPKRALVRAKLGRTMMEKGELKGAIVAYEQAIAQDENLPAWVYFGFGNALDESGELERASAMYQKAIAINPDNAFFYQKLGNALWKTNCRFKEAIAAYQKAIDLNPQNPYLYCSLAKILYHSNKKNISEAIDYNQKAIYYFLVDSHPEFIGQHWDSSKLMPPEFLIIGMRKCGTTSLYDYLLQHPQILPAIEKEIHVLSCHRDLLTEKEQNWYFSHFPKRPEGKQFITGEASTTYIDTPGLPKIIFAHFPQTKIIVILRNPVDRVISHYYHRVRVGLETETLEKVVNLEIEALETVPETEAIYLAFSQQGKQFKWEKVPVWSWYLPNSMYVYYLEQWFSIWPREQFLILRSEDLSKNPAGTMEKTFKFLGLPDYKSSQYQHHNQGGYSAKIDEDLRRRLTEFFRPHNQRLEKYLGREFNWD